MPAIHVWLAYTNILAYLPLSASVMRFGFTWPTFLVMAVVVASILMHLSETKHGLDPGPTLRNWSTFLLNFDRLTALTAFVYFLHMWCVQDFPLIPVYLFGEGLVFSWIGENAKSAWIYCVMHTMWHLLVYVAMAQLIRPETVMGL